MRPKRSSHPPVNVGISLMLVTFFILCMIILAVLSFSTALRDKEYSLKNAENISAYYKACNLAEEKLADLNAKSQTEIVTEFSVPINDTKNLQITLDLQSDGTYRITKRQTVSIDEWTETEKLPVLGSQDTD